MNQTEVDHSNREHALCSASGSDRWLNCPGSVAMCEQVPHPESSVYAQEGTDMHELCEKLLLPIALEHNNPKATKKELAKIFRDNGLTEETAVKFDDYPGEMVEYAKEYVRLIMGLVEKHSPKKIMIEQKVELDKTLGMFGTADLFFAFRKKLKTKSKAILSMIDIKYGAGKVVEPDSPQLLYYALGVQEAFQKVPFDEFWCYIYQPRIEHERGSFRRHIWKRKDALKWKKTFTDGAKLSLSLLGDAEGTAKNLKAGSHCIFCDAKPVCAAHAKYLNEQAGLDFTDDPDLLVPAVSEQRTEIREFMTDEQVSRLLTHRKEIEKFLNSLVEYAINRDQEGDPIPGYKVVLGGSRRRWLAPSIVVKGLAELGITNPYDQKLKGLTAIEQEIKNKNPKLKKKDIPAMIANLVEKTAPKPTLVEESDARPAISVDAHAGKDFEDIDE